jgi:hypothetical protein
LSKIQAFLLTTKKLPPASHKDDFGFVKEALEKNNIEILEVTRLPRRSKAFVVISGSDLAGKEKFISNKLTVIKKIVMFITSDEAGAFDADKIDHPDIKIWRQYPYKKDSKFFKMALGAPMTMKSDIPKYAEKEKDIFFAGQITHQRRQELAETIESMGIKDYVPTPGFMQGDPRRTYYQKMCRARVVPAPAGHPCIDSFRFYEALEMLAMPIGDTKDSNGVEFDIWNYIFKSKLPFPRTKDWSELPEILEKILSDYPNNMHQAVAWWIKYKRDFANKIMEQINES